MELGAGVQGRDPCFGVSLPVVRKECEGCVEAMRCDVTCVGGGFAKLWVLRDSRVHGAEWFQPPEKSLYTSTTHALEYLLIIIKWCSGHVSWKKKDNCVIGIILGKRIYVIFIISILIFHS